MAVCYEIQGRRENAGDFDGRCGADDAAGDAGAGVAGRRLSELTP